MTRIDMTARELHGLFAPVLPHVCTDPELPLLNAVHVEARDGVVYCAGTDRFTLGVTRLKVPPGVTDFVLLIDRSDAAAMLKLFTFTKDDDPELTVIVDAVPVPVGGGLSVHTLALRVDARDGTRLVLHDRSQAGIVRPVENWRTLIGAAVHRKQRPAAPALILAPSFLPRWAKAAGKGQRLMAFMGPEPTDTILFVVEDRFAGLWQPLSHLDADKGKGLLDDNAWRAETPRP